MSVQIFLNFFFLVYFKKTYWYMINTRGKYSIYTCRSTVILSYFLVLTFERYCLKQYKPHVHNILSSIAMHSIIHLIFIIISNTLKIKLVLSSKSWMYFYHSKERNKKTVKPILCYTLSPKLLTIVILPFNW